MGLGRPRRSLSTRRSLHILKPEFFSPYKEPHLCGSFCLIGSVKCEPSKHLFAASSCCESGLKVENDMSRIEVLDNSTHPNLQVLTNYAANLGDNTASTVTFITEFAEVQKEYPILFRRAPENGEYQAIVLFGLQDGENLFLIEPDSRWQRHLGWNASYIPAAIARGPFSIGLRKQMQQGVEAVVPIIHVDMDHPKVTTEGGVNVFLSQGGNSEFLNRISDTLNIIRDGMLLNKAMFDAYQRHELIEDVSIDVTLDNGDKFKVSGFQTINADRLLELSGAALEELSRAGFLQAAYFVAASLSNIQKLVEKKNLRLRV